MKRRVDRADLDSGAEEYPLATEPEYAIELPERPRALTGAMILMFLGAAFTLVGIVYTLLNVDDARASVIQRDARQTSGPKLGPGEIDAAVQIAIVFSIVAGLFGIGLWIAMAIFNGQGRRWARIIASALCTFSAVSVAYGLAAVREEGVGAANLAVRAVILAIGVAAIVLMYRPESTEFYGICGERRAQARVRKYG